MDNETLIALRESIDYWKHRVRDKDHWQICPLCLLGKKRSFNKCDDCIIKKTTGKRECHGTPFWEDSSNSPIYEKNMVEYLESFLPKDKEKDKMKFVIKDDKQKEKDVEVELFLKQRESGVGYGDVEVWAGEKVLIAFRDGRVIKPCAARMEGIKTDGAGRILECE